MLSEATSCNIFFILSLSIVYLIMSINLVRTDITKGYPGMEKRWFLNGDEVENGVDETGGTWTPTDNNTVTNVTVQLGVTAYLHCHVRPEGENNAGHVSWVRRRDWHILSSGMLTYTNDERFQIMHAESSDDWILQIKFVQKRDNGTYECQVATGTGLISHFVNLQIVVPEASIPGTAERHVDVGSVISLMCIIEKSPTPPQYVFWYHNDRMINYDTARSGVSVDTVPGAPTHSRLTIRDTHDADSGNYTCSASNTEPASIYVFVEEGDKMASLRKKSEASSMYSTFCQTLFLTFLLLIV